MHDVMPAVIVVSIWYRYLEVLIIGGSEHIQAEIP